MIVPLLRHAESGELTSALFATILLFQSRILSFFYWFKMNTSQPVKSQAVKHRLFTVLHCKKVNTHCQG